MSSKSAIITHLNADTSWLFSIPFPQATQSCVGSYFHILVDPWLSGPQHDFHRHFSQQWHVEDPSCANIKDVETRIREIEQKNRVRGRGKDSEESRQEHDQDEVPSRISLVLISFDFTDHCHEETLRQVDPRVPVWAVKAAAKLIRGFRHFHTVQEIPVQGSLSKAIGTFATERTSQLGDVLPRWLDVMRLQPLSLDVGNLHTAILLAYSAPTTGEATRKKQLIVYTPHGIPSEHFQLPETATVDVVALIHGLHRVVNPWYLGGIVNLGRDNGLAAAKALGSRYWIPTHDEDKKGEGFVSAVITREALQFEDLDDNAKMSVNYRHVANGQSLSLE